MLSVNVIASHLAEHSRDAERVQALRRRLEEINRTWDLVCEEATGWQERLQTELLEVITRPDDVGVGST